MAIQCPGSAGRIALSFLLDCILWEKKNGNELTLDTKKAAAFCGPFKALLKRI